MDLFTKHPIMTFLKILLSIFLIFFSQAEAKNESEEKNLCLLDNLRSFYQGLDSFKITYAYTVKHLESVVQEPSASKIIVCGDQYRLLQGDQELFCDGETIWAYLSDLGEVTISDCTTTDMDISFTKIYMIYQQGYEPISFQEKEINSKIYDVVVLVPTDKESSIRKITLEIDRTTQQIYSWEMLDQEAMHYLFKVESFEKNIKIPKNYFTFNVDKYPDLEIIDLREESTEPESK